MSSIPGPPSNGTTPGRVGTALKALAFACSSAVLAGEAVQFAGGLGVPLHLPNGVYVPAIAFALTLLAYCGIGFVRRYGLHIVVSVASFAVVLTLVVTRPSLTDPPAPGHRASYDLPGDASNVFDQQPLQGSTFAPGDRITAIFTLRNMGTVTWRNRRFCRYDELNNRDNLVTKSCVRVPDTRPGGYATVRIPVTVPEREGPFVAEFKLADEDGLWFFSSDRTGPARLEIVVTG